MNSPNISKSDIVLILSGYVLSVERQTAAIRAIRDVEIEHLLTDLRLLRSYFNKEQLQTPVLQFFAENFPNLSVVRNEENKQAEIQWKTEEDNASEDNRRELHASLLRRLSMAYSDYSAAIPSLGGFDFSSKAGTGHYSF